jgi:fumarate reductase flavoprotein subunit
MNSGNNIAPEKLETDVVIVGGGGTGLAAAVAAKEAGAEVIVLERRRSTGGNTALAGGIFASESSLQRRARIDVRRDVCLKEAVTYAHNRINPRIFRAFVNKSGDTIRWLQDMGLKIDGLSPYYPGQALITWHCPRAGARSATNVLAKRCKALGIPIILQTRATKLLLDKQGKINGVLAKRKRQPLQVIAKSVIIGSGGFAGNKKLLKKFSPRYMDNIYRIGLPHQGDGILMALEIGADTDGLGTLHMTGPGFPHSRLLSGLTLEPVTIWVNNKGVRFSDEGTGVKSFEAVNAQMRQHGMQSFTLLDTSIKQFLIDNGFTKGMGSLRRAQRVKSGDWLKALEVEAEKGTVKISDSWDEIARWMGVNPRVLKATIKEYNQVCDDGYDPVFGKDRVYLKPLRTPPYYALRSAPGMLTTMGGLKINEHMQVINKNDNPIAGLFAGGSDTGGWEPDTYNINLAGTTCGFAINSGRIAGENAARYVLSAKKHAK